MIILAIESSCDETGVGIAELGGDGTVTLLADEVASSVDEHARFGGVVPEIASRAHLEALGPADSGNSRELPGGKLHQLVFGDPGVTRGGRLLPV